MLAGLGETRMSTIFCSLAGEGLFYGVLELTQRMQTTCYVAIAKR